MFKAYPEFFSEEKKSFFYFGKFWIGYLLIFGLFSYGFSFYVYHQKEKYKKIIFKNQEINGKINAIMKNCPPHLHPKEIKDVMKKNTIFPACPSWIFDKKSPLSLPNLFLPHVSFFGQNILQGHGKKNLQSFFEKILESFSLRIKRLHITPEKPFETKNFSFQKILLFLEFMTIQEDFFWLFLHYLFYEFPGIVLPKTLILQPKPWKNGWIFYGSFTCQCCFISSLSSS